MQQLSPNSTASARAPHPYNECRIQEVKAVDIKALVDNMYDLHDIWLDLGRSLGISEDKLMQLCLDYPADEHAHNINFKEKILELWARSSESGLINLSDLAQICWDYNQNTCERLEKVYKLTRHDAEKGSLSKPHYNPRLVVIHFSSHAKLLVSQDAHLERWRKKAKKLELENKTLQQQVSALRQMLEETRQQLAHTSCLRQRHCGSV